MRPMFQSWLVNGEIPHPPVDWTIERNKLDKGVMIARMLVSGSHNWVVVCICNFSDKSFAFKANSGIHSRYW